LPNTGSTIKHSTRVVGHLLGGALLGAERRVERGQDLRALLGVELGPHARLHAADEALGALVRERGELAARRAERGEEARLRDRRERREVLVRRRRREDRRELAEDRELGIRDRLLRAAEHLGQHLDRDDEARAVREAVHRHDHADHAAARVHERAAAVAHARRAAQDRLPPGEVVQP
jgi:hypothetical protein